MEKRLKRVESRIRAAWRTSIYELQFLFKRLKPVRLLTTSCAIILFFVANHSDITAFTQGNDLFWGIEPALAAKILWPVLGVAFSFEIIAVLREIFIRKDEDREFYDVIDRFVIRCGERIKLL